MTDEEKGNKYNDLFEPQSPKWVDKSWLHRIKDAKPDEIWETLANKKGKEIVSDTKEIKSKIIDVKKKLESLEYNLDDIEYFWVFYFVMTMLWTVLLITSRWKTWKFRLPFNASMSVLYWMLKNIEVITQSAKRGLLESRKESYEDELGILEIQKELIRMINNVECKSEDIKQLLIIQDVNDNNIEHLLEKFKIHEQIKENNLMWLEIFDSEILPALKEALHEDPDKNDKIKMIKNSIINWMEDLKYFDVFLSLHEHWKIDYDDSELRELDDELPDNFKKLFNTINIAAITEKNIEDYVKLVLETDKTLELKDPEELLEKLRAIKLRR